MVKETEVGVFLFPETLAFKYVFWVLCTAVSVSTGASDSKRDFPALCSMGYVLIAIGYWWKKIF